jgi:hypothetical protein
VWGSETACTADAATAQWLAGPNLFFRLQLLTLPCPDHPRLWSLSLPQLATDAGCRAVARTSTWDTEAIVDALVSYGMPLSHMAWLGACVTQLAKSPLTSTTTKCSYTAWAGCCCRVVCHPPSHYALSISLYRCSRSPVHRPPQLRHSSLCVRLVVCGDCWPWA